MVINVFKISLGWVGAAASEQGITGIVLPKNEKESVQKALQADVMKGSSAADSEIVRQAVTLLQKYFSGERVSFDVPLDLRYHTPFQQAVWKAAREIPYGETRSYAWIAKRIGRPKSARAVGQAMGANPIPVIIP